MSSDHDFFLPTCDQLHGADNYFEWECLIQTLLESEGLENFISTTCSPDVDVPEESHREWKINNARAKVAIRIVPRAGRAHPQRRYSARNVEHLGSQLQIAPA
jgi:hypothetical protein